MKKFSYHHEQLDLLTLFVSAIDDGFLFRYDAKTREPKSKINVRYVFGHKTRVMHSIVNPEKSLHLPVVAVSQSNLARDPRRVMNKHQDLYRPSTGGVNEDTAKIPTPIPVTMDVELTIFAKYKEDIDQIAQNFAAFANPYFIVSWKIPENFGITFIDELRSEVEWTGPVTYDIPDALTNDDKYRIQGNTTFQIKGWIFPPSEGTVAPIYEVKTNFHAVNLADRIYNSDDFDALSADFSETDVVGVSAYPEFTNLFYSTSGTSVPMENGDQFRIENNNNFLLLGKRFDYNNAWYLSSGSQLNSNYEAISSAKSPVISAYRIPNEQITVYSDNSANMYIPLSSIENTGNFTIVTANSAAWKDTDEVFSFI